MLELDAGEGGYFFGDGVCPRRMYGGSLAVSSELLNMLLHVKPGRCLRGNFPGREFVLVGFGGNDGCLYVNSKLPKSYYMLHLEVCGGGIIRWVSPTLKWLD